MIQANVDLNSGSEADVYVRLRDRANGYRIRLTSGGTIKLQTGTNRTNRDPTNRDQPGTVTYFLTIGGGSVRVSACLVLLESSSRVSRTT
ncbi:MAG: hypothetical protein IIB57_15405 [Planctomycetes bacterium]|nr:hypothetical protein [Planctomycetota bacterium]